MRKKMKITTIKSRQIILSATLLLAMLLTMATATAQVFIMDDEFEASWTMSLKARCAKTPRTLASLSR